MHELCKLLSDGEFHSGSQLGAALGITRAGVWKKVKKMQQLGIAVQSSAGQGYRIDGGIKLLDENLLRKGLPENLSVQCMVSIDSTNAEAIRRFRAGEQVQLLVAEEQTAGRGRRGRDWCSPYASNLYFTYVWPVTAGAAQLEGLSLAVGLAVYRVLSNYQLTGLGLKWPNDVLVGQAKLAGILVELVGDISDRCSAVIGVGINVNMLGEQQIGQSWVSMQQLLGRNIDRNQLLLEVFNQLQQTLLVLQEHGFASLRQEWEQAHLWTNQYADICHGDGKISGKVLGVGAGGELRMQVDGQEQSFSGGELSLRLHGET